MKTQFNRNRFIAISFLTILLLVALLGLTPMGKALGQTLLQFFTRTQSETLPEPTAAPVALFEVAPGDAVPTPTPYPSEASYFAECGDGRAPLCSFEEIRSKVSFPIKQLAVIPEGFKYTGAIGGEDGVSLVYDRPEHQGRLFLSIWPWAGTERDKYPIPPSAIVETVRIGTFYGEYARGAWFNNGTYDTWDPDSGLQTLRWREGELAYDLALIGRYPVEELDKEALAALAQNLTDGPIISTDAQTGEAALPEGQIRTASLEEANKQASFTLKTADWLPDGYSFHFLQLLPSQNVACLHYQLVNEETFDPLSLSEGPDLPLPFGDDIADHPTYASTVAEKITISGADKDQGLYGEGNMGPLDLCDLPASNRRVLMWKAGGVNYRLDASMVNAVNPFLTKLELIRIAESINGAGTTASTTLDPERLTSVQEAEQLAGFDVKEPTRLPAGENFSYATYSTFSVTSDLKTVTLFYKTISIAQTYGVTETLESRYPVDLTIDEQVTVNGHKAYYRQGCGTLQGWDKNCFGTFVLIWHAGNMEYELWGTVQWGLTREVIIDIAESLR